MQVRRLSFNRHLCRHCQNLTKTNMAHIVTDTFPQLYKLLVLKAIVHWVFIVLVKQIQVFIIFIKGLVVQLVTSHNSLLTSVFYRINNFWLCGELFIVLSKSFRKSSPADIVSDLNSIISVARQPSKRRKGMRLKLDNIRT